MAVHEIKRHQARVPAAGNRSSESVVLKKLSPQAAGAKKLAARYGDALVCVRYREDPAGKRRLTTIELIVEQRPIPAPQSVRIGVDEVELRRQVKAEGGTWDWEHKVWRLKKSAVRKLKLAHRVVSEKA